MYHIDRSGIEADHGNCGSFPGKTADRAVPDDVMLYRAWHGRSDDGKLLYYGGDLCADSDCTGDRDQSGLRAFLCFLFRNRGGYHTAGGIGSLCGFRDRESASDENGAQCDAAGAFIVPYILAFNPAMVFIDTNALQVVQICITSLLGIFGIAAALNGFLFGWLSVVERLVLIVGGLCMMDPGAWTDLLGLVLVGGVTFWQKNHGLEKDAETGVG